MRRGKAVQAAQSRFRSRRFELVDGMIRLALTGRDEVSVLDVGGRPDYWALLGRDIRSRVHITCLNFESEFDIYSLSQPDLRVTCRTGDACRMPEFDDGSFDLVHSNSVIEHVGSLCRMIQFAGETQRVARAYFIQTPNYWFPIDPHYGVPFFHYLPDMAKFWIFQRTSVGFAARCDATDALHRIDHTRMVGRGLLATLFPDAEIRVERVAGLPKSLMAVRAA